MNKKSVIIFLLAMILTSGVILIGIKVYQSVVFGSIFTKETGASFSFEVVETESTTATEPQVVEFLTEADARNYVANYATANGIDISLYPDRIYNGLYRNPNALQFVLDYPLYAVPAPTNVPVEEGGETEETDASMPQDIVSLEGQVSTARLTPLWTYDERWGYTRYGNDSFCFTGSAPTCVSICAMYLLRNAAFSPQWIAEYSMNNGYCDETCDGSHESALVGDGGFGLGINVTQIPASDPERIKRNLDVPNPIICDVGDHYIILVSYEEDEFTVIDPTSEYDTNRTWSWTELSTRLEGLWVYRVL